MEEINEIKNKMDSIFEEHFIQNQYIKLLFKMSVNNIHTSKFKCLQNAMSNIFINDEKREEIMNTFCNMQRFIHAIYRLKYIWRWKKAIIYNTDDLYMSPIHVGQKNTITILQNNTKYIFHIRELIGSINTSLSNACHFFADPIICKNPYTNIPFDKASLYNIYFALRESTYIIPILLHQYFLYDFNLSEFAIMNKQLMNQEYLRTYVDNNCVQDIHTIVNEMFDDHRIEVKINTQFPNDKLFTIMKPYLQLYFTSNYSLHKYKKQVCFRILHMKLHEFVNYNPQFGRKKVKLVQETPFSKSKKMEYYFDDVHIIFSELPDCEFSSKYFMNSHLCKNDFYNSFIHYNNNHNNTRRHSHDDNDDHQTTISDETNNNQDVSDDDDDVDDSVNELENNNQTQQYNIDLDEYSETHSGTDTDIIEGSDYDSVG